MRIKTYNNICNTLFWIKCYLALLISTGGLAGLSYLVYDLYDKANLASFIDGSLQGSSELARLEPPGTYTYLGFSINWYQTEPKKYSINGKRAIIYDYGTVLYITDSNQVIFFNSGELMSNARKVRKVGGALQLTITIDTTSVAEIIDLATDIPDIAYEQIVKDCEAINGMGVPVFLNFAPQMNSNIHKYKMNPVAYKASYSKLADLVHQRLVYTVMVWAPSPGYDYPKIGQALKLEVLADGALAALDTSKNNQIDAEDDPYEPFYPGDQHVDWVGLSFNWSPLPGETRFGAPPEGYFVGCIDGNENFLNEFNSQGTQANLNFYARYAENKKKPMILSQVGVGTLKGSPEFDDQTILNWKSTIWTDLFTSDFLASHSKLKGIVIIETERPITPLNGFSKLDFQILNPPTGADFINSISKPEIKFSLPFVGNLKAGADGKIAVVKQIN